ncbi:hypothetical protein [Hydrogenophaga sp.]|uniref:hypothetical protein n=1 Tax=Hydrogenophaga sp. TaxID=1904254 RepID=UPI00271E7605|nr:hypothetical protein [Hydrogenophaga sp.]MDO9434423.1 hypothetical protein [Hydrogenophaga sp.]
MTALATFDRHGHWLSTSVCERAACPLAASLGVRWGKWSDGLDDSHPDAQAQHQHALTQVRQLIGPHVSERLRFSHTAANDATRPLPHELEGEGAVAHVVLHGTVLLCVRTGEGFTGLLCEAGDWVLLPAGVPHVFDAGTAPDVELLRLSAGTRGWFPWETGTPLPPALPALEAFVEQLLQELGEDIDEGESASA